ncbi:unnamed protein product [Thlaspi arvense]|uniref:Uncharacterized protein n=1 Tax=Thlaspi arvense TaxID=13288 RepID=A0AAU9SSY8_THLAR|nr:unnamed protein product [Thlaspi arvense]
MATSSGRLIAGLTASMSSIESRNANPAQSNSLICRNQINGVPPIVLRSSQRSRRWLIEAVPPVKSWDGSDDAEYIKKKSDATGGKTGGHVVAGKHEKTIEIVIAAAATAALGVGNRVMYVAVYYSILYFRYRAGIVTKEMLSVPKVPFLIVGILESLALASGMAAAANLSGPSTTVLSQTFLIWQILFSIIFLGRRYRVNQIFGCILVAFGVIVSVASGSGAAHSFKDAGIFWSLLMVLSFMLQGADTVMKEVIFLDSKKRLKGASLDLFVVNSYGSAFQVVCIALLLPFLSKLWGIPFNQLPSYLRDGGACFLNIGTRATGCEGAPLLPIMFVLMNMAYNISLLRLIKISSAVVSSLASTVSVPIAVYLFTLPLPYLGVASSLPTGFVAGTVILVLGMLLYAWTPSHTSDSIIPSPPST